MDLAVANPLLWLGGQHNNTLAGNAPMSWSMSIPGDPFQSTSFLPQDSTNMGTINISPTAVASATMPTGMEQDASDYHQSSHFNLPPGGLPSDGWASSAGLSGSDATFGNLDLQDFWMAVGPGEASVPHRSCKD